MAKRVSYNGIEISTDTYDASAGKIFDYLEKLVKRIEKGLERTDEKSDLSIDLEFSPGKQPRARITPGTRAKAETVARVAQTVKRTRASGSDRLSARVKVNLEVNDS